MPIAPYGTWPSPLSPDVMGGARVSLTGLQVVDGACWWSESRPHEGGRMAVMRLSAAGGLQEMSPPGVSVRSRIHEYGGGAHFAEAGGLLYTDQDEQALWWTEPGPGPPRRLTPPAPDGGSDRYGDARPVAGGRFVVALRERHRTPATVAADGRAGVIDEIVAIDRRGDHGPSPLVSGRDFFAAPRPSPDGRRLAWLAWDHPNMPWDGTELWVADVDQGDGIPVVVEATLVAGGPDESVGQPTWVGPDLFFVSDRFGWWQPFGWRPGSPPWRLATEEADYANADWNLGQSSFAVTADGRLIGRIRGPGGHRLVVDGADLAVQPAVTISALATAPAPGPAGPGPAGPDPVGPGPVGPLELYLIGAAVAEPPALYRLTVPAPTTTPTSTPPVELAATVVEEIYRPRAAPLEADWVSEPEELTFTTVDATPVSLLFYPPHAPGWAAPAGSLPPLVVLCHGGPTAGVDPGFDAGVQLWTTRGVAVAAVDYRGSTGHGRSFRRLLDGAWGQADAEDVRAAATFLADCGLVDRDRMVVKGQSAGGFTALRSLDPGGPFACALVSYGVTDLEALAADTHKFEARYLDRLVGPWPEAAALYHERSPARHPERVDGAVLLLQGSEDPIVPPDQAQRMAEALRGRGLRCDLVLFAGEGHGFRRAETLTRCAELEIAFVRQVLGVE